MKISYKRNFLVTILFCFTLLLSTGCTKKTDSNGSGSSGNGGDTTAVPAVSNVAFWLTNSSQTALLQKQNVSLTFSATSDGNPAINVDTTLTFQTIDGFGYTLTDGSAYVINQLSAGDQSALLKELFGSDSASIGISYLRLSIGASDLSASVYSYDDMPVGQTDVNLQNFNLSKDKSDVITVLKQILAINPNIKIVATPWSPPAWMKDNDSSKGGSLEPQFYDAYARYFISYLQAMKVEGITIDAVTPQNEPINPDNNPSMYMASADEAAFIKNNLGPALKAAGLTTKILIWDHNCDGLSYPTAILNDANAKPYIDGSAFHLYAGDISALSQLHNAYPDKNVYFTEQYTSSTGDFAGDLKWHMRNVVIGATRNWSRNALEWNLANDPNYGPHTVGGCSSCKGALTVGTGITRNVSYYIIAHASKFVPPGSVRIASNIAGNLNNVAFKRPDGKKVLIVENDDASSQTFNIQFNSKSVTTTLDGGSVGTYVW